MKGLNSTIKNRRFSDWIKNQQQPGDASKGHTWHMRTQKSPKKKDEQNILSTHQSKESCCTIQTPDQVGFNVRNLTNN